MSYSETAALILLCSASAVLVIVMAVGGIVAKHWGGDDE